MQRLLLQRAASRAAAGAVAPRTLVSRPSVAPAATAASASAKTPPPPPIDAPGDDGDDEPTCVRARLAPIAGPIAEVLSDALLGFGAQSVTVAELRRPGEPESPIYDAGGCTSGGGGGGGGVFSGDGGGSGGGGGRGHTGYWPRCEVVAHFPLEADADAAIRDACAVADSVAGVLLAEGGGAGSRGSGEEEDDDDSGYLLPPAYLLAAVANREWVEQIKASYVPLDVVPGVVRIVPEGSDEAAEGEGEEGEGEGEGGAVGPSGGGRLRRRLKLVLRPGVAFGTGEHPTTRLCLRAVARLGGLPVNGAAAAGGGSGGGPAAGELSPAPSLLSSGGGGGGPVDVLDYGTGSGVLAVAALLLGARRAVGTDTDPLAVRASAANARLNGVSRRFAAVLVPPSLPPPGGGADPVEALLRAEAAVAAISTTAAGGGGGEGDAGEQEAQRPAEGQQGPAAAAAAAAEDGEGPFGLVVANILRGPLLELAPRLARLCAPGGRLLLSGVLGEQAPEVRAAYEGLGFGGFVVETEGSWACLSATKEDGRRRRP